ncbi:MAG: AAA family ATPase [Planctomycetota bacterium]
MNSLTSVPAAATSLSLPELLAKVDQLRGNLNAVLLGKEPVIEFVVACLLARGHLLFDDLPGLGKTTLAKAIAASLGGRFGRVQCTPDLLPSDITGFNIFNQKTREFEFVPGPVFADILLADEINRTTPRTQSALFEAMAERQVTIDSHSRRLSDSFVVIATQNTVESHGAYPLTDAHLDRFTMKLQIGYPDRNSEVDILGANIGGRGAESVETQAVLGPGELGQIQRQIAAINVTRKVREYMVDVARAIRAHREVTLGVSPRGLIIWQNVAQAWACLHGRDFVTPDDVRVVAEPTVGVRIFGEFESAAKVIQAAFDQVAIPT